MPPKARQIRIDQRGAAAEMQALEQRSDEELGREQKYRSAAQAILGARAAERYDDLPGIESRLRAAFGSMQQELGGCIGEMLIAQLHGRQITAIGKNAA